MVMEERRNPVAVIATRFGEIQVELYPDEAPNTVNCFISLAKKGLFDRRKIRRIAPGFVLQPSYSDFDDERCAISLDGEYRNNGFENRIPFEQGTVAMGGEGNVASGSCFFITLTDEAGRRLDGAYAAFGKVIKGWEVVEQIAALPTEKVDIGIPGVDVNEPITPEYMEKVTVETWGVAYDEPVILEREEKDK